MARERVAAPLGFKVCPQCRETQPTESFSRSSRAKDGLDPWCRRCKRAKNAARWERVRNDQNARQRERYRSDPDYRARLNKRTRARHHATYQSQQHRPGHLRRKYGLTEQDFQALVDGQGGVCAVCGLPETVVDKRGTAKLLSVDHDHVTGIVRGLLCRKCNVALGLLRDDADLVGKLLTYVLRGGPA